MALVLTIWAPHYEIQLSEMNQSDIIKIIKYYLFIYLFIYLFSLFNFSIIINNYNNIYDIYEYYIYHIS